MIYKLLVEYFCKNCNTPFSTLRSNLHIELKDLPKEVAMQECQSCHAPGGVDIAHVMFEDKAQSASQGFKYRYKIECNLCNAQWENTTILPEGQYFGDLIDKILQDDRTMCWCGHQGNIVLGNPAKHRRVLSYRRVV